MVDEDYYSISKSLLLNQLVSPSVPEDGINCLTIEEKTTHYLVRF